MDPLSDEIPIDAPYTPPTDAEYAEQVRGVLRYYRDCPLEQALLGVPPWRREAVKQLIEGAKQG